MYACTHDIMEDNLEQLVAVLVISPSSTHVIPKIVQFLEEQTSQSIASFVSESFQSLLTIEHWAWQVLSRDFRQWIDEKSYSILFDVLHSFNIKLLSNHDGIEPNTKIALLIPSNNDWIDGVLNQIESSNNIFLTIASLWFDVLSYLALDYYEIKHTSSMIYINKRLAHDFLMTNQYKLYLKQLREPNIPQSIFTAKQLFYLKTCSFSLNVFICSQSQHFPFTGEEVMKFLGDDYLQMIREQSYTVDSWSKELLSCITHLIGLICSCCWLGDQQTKHIKMLVPPEDTTYDHILALIRIISHQPFHRCISAQWYNDETLLIDATLVFLLAALETNDLGYFISSKTILPTTLLNIAQTSSSDRICICAYLFLAEILSDEQLKELKIADNISRFFLHMLEEEWRCPTQTCKKIPIPALLKGFLSLSKNDTIQTATANSNKTELLIELSDQYPMVFDILWALSFNFIIQQKIRSNQSFMTKLTQIEQESSDACMLKIVNGILWNLNSEHVVSGKCDDTKFDIMISYSHRDKEICKKLYDELVRAGYRVWIDFDQMHGNIMDAMAQAIEQSRTILICMSEHYRKSNYCRAEAQYAFQRQLKMVPVLVQKQYKPDGWLLFLTSQLLHVDFTKHAFLQAIDMLMKELKATHLSDNTSIVAIQPKRDGLVLSMISSSLPQSASQLVIFHENVRDWTESHVRKWLLDNNLSQMASILYDLDGLSLIYLSEYMVGSEPQQMLSLLQQDSLRRTSQSVSVVELSRFRSLIERNGLASLVPVKPLVKVNSKKTDYTYLRYCCIM